MHHRGDGEWVGCFYGWACGYRGSTEKGVLRASQVGFPFGDRREGSRGWYMYLYVCMSGWYRGKGVERGESGGVLVDWGVEYQIL